MRVAFAIEDDLQAYARRVTFAWPTSMREVEGAQVATVHREGNFQAELCCVRGGFVIPEHVHPGADTIEVTLAGAVRLTVNGVDPFDRIPDERLPAFAQGRGIRINATDVHGGRVLPCGAWFLSIQLWVAEPRSVLTDYRGATLGARHEALL